MASEKTFGLLIFSGVIVLAVSRNAGILSGINWFNIFKKQKNRNGSSGDFVLRGSNSCRDHKWKEIVSEEDSRYEETDHKCEIEVTNDMKETLVFSWIMPSGKLHHFTPINDGSIEDGSVSNCHVEYTKIYDAFLCIKQSKHSPKTLSEVSDEVSVLTVLKLATFLTEVVISFSFM
jgi:hypothetical protein